MVYKIERSSYATMFGPTKGDKVRLADTDLIIEVEDDKTVYGEEVKFGVILVVLGEAKLIFRFASEGNKRDRLG